MEKSENETIILFNDKDLSEGYFVFSTSKLSQWNKLLKRIGGEDKLVDVRKDVVGREVRWFSGKVPKKFAGPYWGIGLGKKVELSREELDKRRARFEMVRKRRAVSEASKEGGDVDMDEPDIP